MRKIVIIGAGGHGKVIADLAVKNGYKEIVFLDDDPGIKECAGFPVAGITSDAPGMEGDKFVAIGNARMREKIQQNLKAVTLIHPDAVISRRVQIGEGTAVMAGAVINSDAVIGKGCIVNTGTSIDHDCRVGDFAHVAVGAHVAGACVIGERTWIGAGAVVSNNVTICSDCMIGAGAVVIQDLGQSGTYVGSPAKKIKQRGMRL